MTLILLKSTDQIFYRLSIDLDLSDVFLMIIFMFSVHQIKWYKMTVCHISHDVGLDYLAKVLVIGFSTVKLCVFLAVISILEKMI